MASLIQSVALAAAFALGSAGGTAGPPASGPQVGEMAPPLRLQDQHGTWHTLEAERGKWLVVYFYPKDFTPGCTTQVCAFRDDIVALRKAGAKVFGVSLDDVKSHAEFAAKYQVPFALLSDAQGSVARAWGVYAERAGVAWARRETFLIDPQGRVARRYVDVDPQENARQVLADLDALRQAAQ